MEGRIIFGFLILAVLVYFFYTKVLSKFKAPKLGCVVFVDGGIKSGKSLVSVFFSLHAYKVRHFVWSIMHKIKDYEEPLIYSNIPLNIPYVDLTKEMVLRLERFNYGSIVFIDEASLFADSRLSIDDKKSNLDLLKLVKLFGHETHGGMLIYNSQSIDDMHVAFRRGLSQYFYVHHITKWIPFFCIAYMREMIYAEDGSVINNVSDDLEKSLQKVIIPKRYMKYYDRYAFSYETDGLPHNHKPKRAKSLKAKRLVSMRDWFGYDYTDKENKK